MAWNISRLSFLGQHRQAGNRKFFAWATNYRNLKIKNKRERTPASAHMRSIRKTDIAQPPPTENKSKFLRRRLFQNFINTKENILKIKLSIEYTLISWIHMVGWFVLSSHFQQCCTEHTNKLFLPSILQIRFAWYKFYYNDLR